jgi:subtilisin family serine protease
VTFKLNLEIGPGGFAPVDSVTVKRDTDGTMYPVNQLLVRLATSATPGDASRIAQSAGGTLVGGLPEINLYQFTIPTSSIAQLKSLIASVATMPLVVAAYPNYLGNFSSSNDLEHLVSCFPNAAATIAYDRIGLQRAYAAISAVSPQLRSSLVGIVDTGIDFAHWEFQGVTLRLDPIYSLQDKAGHGTAVAGTIGANNVGAQLISCDPTDAIRSASANEWSHRRSSGHR